MAVKTKDFEIDLLSWSIIAFYFIGWFLLVVAGLFFFGAGEESINFEKFFTFSIFGLASLIFLGAGKAMQVIFNKYKVFQWIYPIVNDLDLGLGRFLNFFRSTANVILVTLLIGLLIGLFSTVTQTALGDVPVVEQQVTETGELILATEPASTSESLLCGVLMSLFFGINYYLYKVQRLYDFTIFFVINIVVLSIVASIFGVMLHTLRYSNSDASVVSVAIIWGLWGLLTALTASLIPIVLLHQILNLVLKATEILSGEVVGIMVMILILLVGVGLTARILQKSKKPMIAVS